MESRQNKTLRYQECLLEQSGFRWFLNDGYEQRPGVHIQAVHGVTVWALCSSRTMFCYLRIVNFLALCRTCIYFCTYMFFFRYKYAFVWIASLCWKLSNNYKHECRS